MYVGHFAFAELNEITGLHVISSLPLDHTTGCGLLHGLGANNHPHLEWMATVGPSDLDEVAGIKR